MLSQIQTLRSQITTTPVHPRPPTSDANFGPNVKARHHLLQEGGPAIIAHTRDTARLNVLPVLMLMTYPFPKASRARVVKLYLDTSSISVPSVSTADRLAIEGINALILSGIAAYRIRETG